MGLIQDDAADLFTTVWTKEAFGYHASIRVTTSAGWGIDKKTKILSNAINGLLFRRLLSNDTLLQTRCAFDPKPGDTIVSPCGPDSLTFDG